MSLSETYRSSLRLIWAIYSGLPWADISSYCIEPFRGPQRAKTQFVLKELIFSLILTFALIDSLLLSGSHMRLKRAKNLGSIYALSVVLIGQQFLFLK